ncbi:LOW QUALITY PROTEIN: receptor-like protein kinase 5 [Asparagus officinalis]|uniref:LOW QUALITY PROTEIN: receptor-like protein kinase 5 n=1 Tax=Asparagus officinalis TaxID=4686 RepID=UPI00098E8080|nr:LOW QUALITY PROTEIN: receptor-like protein kinase 5 [Asparagus officinalis]
MEISRDRDKGRICLTQVAYLKKVLQRFNVSMETKPVNVYLGAHLQLSIDLSPKTAEARELISGSVTEIYLPNFSIFGTIPESLCSGIKNLSYLDLSYNNFSGPFPTTLYTCTKLGYLDLSQNLFVGELPSDINGLSSSLTDLILSANNFSGQIPTSIGELKSIQSLYLDDNLFNGSIPVELAHLSDLQTLALAYNNFAPQRIPAEFGNLTGLSFLWMASMDLVGEIPGSFERLIELQQLDLSMNSLTGNIPNFIWNLRNLQFVYLYKNNFTGEINGTVSALGLERIDVSMNQHLSVLLMYYNQFSGEIPSSIGLLPSLSDLRLYSNKLTGVLPPELGKHCPLWNLEIDDNLLSGELPEDLCARNALASIIVFDNNFTGKIPESLGGCIALDNLQLQRNRFYGDFPPGIWSAANLSTVMLSDNNFSGTIPDKLPWNLTRLEIQNNRFSGKIPSAGENILVFLAGNNLFSGEIPAILTGISQLQSLQLGRNMISGSIPDEISVLKFLTELNLSNNQLIGEIPASIGSLPVLTTLDLSKNQLTGNIPVNIGNLRLNFLNLSSNQLSGQVPFAFQNQAYDKSFLSNPSLCSSDSALSLSRCDHQSKTSNTISPGVRTMIIVLALLLFLIVSGFTFFVIKDYKSRKDEQNLASWKLTSFHTLDFNESNIVKALTDENLIGAGGSGEVYKVAIGNRSGEVVAVKKIRSKTKMDSKLEREFVSEVQILGSIRHTNIVKLWCCISSNDSKLLVYEHMKNGSLYKWLHEKRKAMGPPALDWPRRLGIAIGAARGLCYMHHDCSPSIVHRDVKSSNILLDSEFRAKVADFGLARILVKAGEPCSVTAVAGSFGYMAPECAYAVKVNEKMDVYSFGVVLLELTTGREANEGDEQGGLAGWAWHHFLTGKNATDAIDETIKDPSNLDEIVKVLKLGLVCTGTLPSTRPTMKEAVEILLRCNRTSWNGSKPQAEHDIAPLLCSVRGSRHKSDSSTDDDLDDCNV